MTNQGIDLTVEAHGSGACLISALASDTFTLGYCNSVWQSVANGTQVILQIDQQGNNAAASVPTGLTVLQKYYLVSCMSCGASGGTFQVSASLGGPPITGLTCTGTCIVGALNIAEPIQVNTATSTLTSPDAFAVMGNTTPVYVASSGLQLNTLTTPASALPGGLALDTKYFMVNVSGRQFQLSLTSGGSPITLTTIGVGPLQMSDARAPNNWKFDGLEVIQAPSHLVYGGMFIFGLGNEASILGMVNHVEVSRTWIHEDATQESDFIGYQRGIMDNAAYGNYHDNYIAGATNGEAQGIAGWGSPGPTLITNNFIEATGENTLYGGQQNSSGISNANKLFLGNYYYKPPAWRTNSFSGVPSGACWYDAYDSHHAGGQWYTNTSSGQVYRCNSSGVWATTGASPPATNTLIKLMAEHKNGRAFQYIGNVFSYSWPQAQSGQVFNMGQQQGSGPGMANDTILFTNNKSTHTNLFGNFGESCFLTAALPCLTPLLPHDLNFSNNTAILEQIACGVPSVGGTADCGSHMFTFQPTGYPPINVTWNHNTVVTIPDGLATAFPWDASASFFSPTSPLKFDHWSYTNSIVGYDFEVDPGNPCGPAISGAFTNTTFDRIANPNAGCTAYTSVGATNTFTNWSPQSGNAGVGFVDLANGDLHLSPTSHYSAACSSGCAFVSSDGTDIGADIDANNLATSGAVAGTPSWEQQAVLVLIPGSTKLVFGYEAPTTAACTATIYNAAARIAANQVASVADSSASSVSDIRTRQLYVPGLSASTHYWYKLVCGGGVTMVGDFFTRPVGSGTYTFTFDWSSATAMRYSSSPSMSSSVSLPAAIRQFIPVAANSVLYVQVGTTGPITILVAP